MAIANVNAQTGIAYGVANGNDYPTLLEEITTNGTNETFEAHKRECVEKVAAVLEELGQRNAERQAADIVDNFEWDDYQAEEEEYTYEDSDGNQFRLGYLGGAPLIWCIKTDFVTRARQCSPCVPNAGDLDNPDAVNGIECYGIPAQYLEDSDGEDEADDDSRSFGPSGRPQGWED